MKNIKRRSFLYGAASLGFTNHAFSTLGVVTMRLVSREAWTVYRPDGSILDTSESKTSGLQEAIDFAVAGGFELEVIGGGTEPNGTVNHILRCDQTIVFPPMVNTRMYFGSLLIHFSPKVIGDGFVFDTVVHCTVECNAHIYYQGNGSALRFWPRTPKNGGGTFVIDSKFIFFNIAAVTDGRDFVGVHFDASRGSISHLSVNMVEIEGAAYGPSGPLRPMGDALRVTNGFFKANNILVQRINGFGNVGLRIGQQGNNSEISNNRFTADIDPIQVPGRDKTVGIETWGNHDFFNVSIRGKDFGPGIILQPSAAKNKFIVLENEGTPPVVDNSEARNSVFL